MIDEKKLIEELGKQVFYAELYGDGWDGQAVNVLCFGDVIDAIEQQPKVGEWIPCSERLPKIRQDCLVTVKYTGFMGMHGIWVKTGHMESENDWWGDCAGGEVIAWQPLPEPYNPGTVRKQTNGDRIRTMSATDDGLAELFYSLQYGDEKVEFCGNNEECDDILDGGGTIPDEMCKQCLVEWLQSEVEEQHGEIK